MSINTNVDMYMRQQLAGREVHSMVHKFGRNLGVGTTYEPVTKGAIYRTPQVAAATTLRVKAGNAADDAAGAGAQEVTIEGLDETGALVQEVLATAGGSASASTTTTFIRFFRGWVSKSGSYATISSGSHVADVVIENTAGTENWGTIDLDVYPMSQTEIACYTVPLGFDAYMFSAGAYVDSNKVADIALFKRENILQAAAPYDAMRLVTAAEGIVGGSNFSLEFPFGSYPALTDLIFMSKASASSAVEVNFELILVRDGS